MESAWDPDVGATLGGRSVPGREERPWEGALGTGAEERDGAGCVGTGAGEWPGRVPGDRGGGVTGGVGDRGGGCPRVGPPRLGRGERPEEDVSDPGTPCVYQDKHEVLPPHFPGDEGKEAPVPLNRRFGGPLFPCATHGPGPGGASPGSPPVLRVDNRRRTSASAARR